MVNFRPLGIIYSDHPLPQQLAHAEQVNQINS